MQEFFDFARVHIFSGADQHVLHPTNDGNTSIVAHYRQIARMHPSARINRCSRCLGLMPVALHHGIAFDAELARRSPLNRVPVHRINDLELQMWMGSTH